MPGGAAIPSCTHPVRSRMKTSKSPCCDGGVVTVSGVSRPMDRLGHGGGIFVEVLWKPGCRSRRTLAESGRVAGGTSAARSGPQRCHRSNPAARHIRSHAREGADVRRRCAQAFARVANRPIPELFCLPRMWFCPSLDIPALRRSRVGTAPRRRRCRVASALPGQDPDSCPPDSAG